MPGSTQFSPHGEVSRPPRTEIGIDRAQKFRAMAKALRRSAAVGAGGATLISGVTRDGAFIAEVDGVIVQIVAALVANGVFRLAGDFVWIRRSEGQATVRKITEGGQVLFHAPPVIAHFVMGVQTSREKETTFQLPRNVLQQVLESQQAAEQIPCIHAIFNRVIIDPNMEVCTGGYSAASRIYIMAKDLPQADWALAPAGTRAVDRLPPHLRHVFSFFPFRTDASLANALSILISAFMPMHHLRSGKPIFIIDGNGPGRGKTLLASLVSEILDGLPAEKVAFTESHDELEKRIGAVVRESDGRTIMLVDNARVASGGEFTSTFLEAMATSDEVTIRILGESRNVRRVNFWLWLLTANGARTGPDLADRAVAIQLFLPTGQRFESGPASDVMAYAEEHRRELQAEVLSMVTAWIEAGCPRSDHRHRFSKWAQDIGGVLTHCGFPEFLSNSGEAMDSFCRDSTEGLEWLATRFAGTSRTGMRDVIPHECGWTTGEILQNISSESWPDVFTGGRRRVPSSASLGQFLSGKEGQTVTVSLPVGECAAQLELVRASGRRVYYRFRIRLALPSPDIGEAPMNT